MFKFWIRTVDHYMTPSVQILKMDDSVARAVSEMAKNDIKQILIGDEAEPGKKYYVLKLLDIELEDMQNDRKIRDLKSKLIVVPVTESGNAISGVYDQLKHNPLVVVKDADGGLKGVVTIGDYVKKRYGV